VSIEKEQMEASADSKADTSKDASGDDASLKMLNARKMIELRKRASSVEAARKKSEEELSKPKPPTPREILTKALVDRGLEVLQTAEANYPREMAILVPRLADLIKQGKIKTVSGGELLQFLRAIGLRVSVQTSISVEEHGKFVTLAEKLKKEE
jgi:DNA-binding TFAR19-related protein (PDSD5 family)